jgi:hypothetical protein
MANRQVGRSMTRDGWSVGASVDFAQVRLFVQSALAAAQLPLEVHNGIGYEAQVARLSASASIHKIPRLNVGMRRVARRRTLTALRSAHRLSFRSNAHSMPNSLFT